MEREKGLLIALFLFLKLGWWSILGVIAVHGVN